MTTQTEALKLALEALEGSDDPTLWKRAVAAIKEALAQPEQEPVAWGNFKEDGTLVGLSQHQEDQANWVGRKPLYTTPPQCKPLTDEPNLFWNDDDPEMPHSSIDEFLNDEWCNGCLEVGDVRTVQRAIRLPNETVRVTVVTDDGDIEYETIEAAHGIKGEA